ncbi:MAG: ATP-binding cassette domain-containing protein, partial [Pseudomonadota bacterium]|nr:ATP-binding cassette domain-containing protein [Pseudomonadota bacterium]
MSEKSISVSLDRDHRSMTLADESVAMEVKDWNLYYGTKQALNNVNMIVPEHRVTAFIGPSGCGKSTLLRCFNRMNDLIDIVNV